MITYKKGNLFKENAEALVNTVNCVGVMGRGIALQFKKSFPNNFKSYQDKCNHDQIKPGQVYVYDRETFVFPRYIINFPTKRHWRAPSKIEDIEAGLQDLARVIAELKIQSIAIPPLGCGLGGLNWHDVKKLIEQYLSELTAEVVVFEPHKSPTAKEMAVDKTPIDMTPGRASLIKLMKSYLSGLLDPDISLLEIHKLMFFLQEAGQPLKLKYSKNNYGPYAENLRHVMTKIEGHFLEGYADGGDSPSKILKIINDSDHMAEKYLSATEHQTTSERIERVRDLTEGFESPRGLELLSSVYWLVKDEGCKTPDEVHTKLQDWNAHKRDFTMRQVDIAFTVLKDKNWI